MQKYNLSFIILVGTTVLHLILGALAETYRGGATDALVWSWFISLLIPLYFAIKTRASGLSKGVIACVFVVYTLVAVQCVSMYMWRNYQFPKEAIEREKEWKATVEAFERENVEGSK